ncbi:UNVERIFIED_CONTAM: hypothetical protein HDU68_012225 [Siphonaria sp. JEL0065]|nr:hypothetical protein HDU68_012225 [Siphonaria sp. JEL0065]
MHLAKNKDWVGLEPLCITHTIVYVDVLLLKSVDSDSFRASCRQVLKFGDYLQNLVRLESILLKIQALGKQSIIATATTHASHTTEIPTPQPFLEELSHLFRESTQFIDQTHIPSSAQWPKAAQEPINTLHLCNGSGYGIPQNRQQPNPIPKAIHFARPETLASLHIHGPLL